MSSGTKAKLEAYFVKRLPLHEVWTSAESVAAKYDAWYQAQVKGVSRAIAANVKSDNVPMSVSAKVLNTFMHQLTKYEEARLLVPRLHLPLDARVFGALRRIESTALDTVRRWFGKSPYSLPYDAHIEIQRALLVLVDELNRRQGIERLIGSRIQLNWLWLGGNLTMPSTGRRGSRGGAAR